MFGLLIGTDVCLIFYNFDQLIVRSDQGGSRNLFSDYEHENKSFNVTLAFDDNQFSAHKGKNYHNYNHNNLKYICFKYFICKINTGKEKNLNIKNTLSV